MSDQFCFHFQDKSQRCFAPLNMTNNIEQQVDSAQTAPLLGRTNGNAWENLFNDSCCRPIRVRKIDIVLRASRSGGGTGGVGDRKGFAGGG